MIDLSVGRGAFNLPVSQLNSVPSGGWGDAARCTKIVLRRIEPGTYMMGNPSNGDGNADYHQITLSKPFYMGIYSLSSSQISTLSYSLYSLVCMSEYLNAGGLGEKTEEEWKACLDAYFSIDGHGKSVSPENLKDVMGVYGQVRLTYNPLAQRQNPYKEIIPMLMRKSGIDFDLPTEAEWEYACRAGTTGDYNSADRDVPNAWGLYLMNKCIGPEVCRDGYKTHLGTKSVVDPCIALEDYEESDPPGRSKYYSSDPHVLRGHAYGYSSSATESYYRTCKLNAPNVGQAFRITYRPFCYAGDQGAD